MYIPGLLRTASRPSRICIWSAPYSVFSPPMCFLLSFYIYLQTDVSVILKIGIIILIYYSTKWLFFQPGIPVLKGFILFEFNCKSQVITQNNCFFHNKNNESPVYTRLSSNILHFISVFSFCKQLLHLRSRSQIPEEPDPRMPDSSGHQS